MPKYRLHPFGARTDEDDLTLEIANHHARIYSDEKVYHDWSYTDCVDYVLPPGTYRGPPAMEAAAGLQDLSVFPPAIQNDYCFVILIGRKVHQFQMSESAEKALRNFWERGYLLRNPSVSDNSGKLGFCGIGLGVAIALGALAVAVVTMWLTEGAGGILLGGIGFAGVGCVIYGWRLLSKRPVWQQIRLELLEDGIEVPDPLTQAPYPRPKIDEVIGHLRVF